MKEELREVIVDGKVIPGYYVSNFGNVYGIPLSRASDGRWYRNLSSDYKLLKPNAKKNREHLYVNLCFQNGLFEDYEYAPTSRSKSTSTVKKFVHQLVMNAFRPIMNHPPRALEPYWDTIHPAVKEWIAQTVYINHIDHDPTNNHVDNLEYVTPRENTRKAITHYGGNVANKNKIIIPKKKENKITLLQFVQSDT